ncbi:hypothetical protein TeGR_g722 [Tetraparma gracilis]|uniref:Fe2OG dioxygenase domain-containing protein n=1 Tax=Tetraparma gracilis TaxID=2962635 RepID=A0ABQ6N9V1_9STRA|nr:hypothetical protein TeGR_g722 [Tetraparma gracilis]
MPTYKEVQTHYRTVPPALLFSPPPSIPPPLDLSTSSSTTLPSHPGFSFLPNALPPPAQLSLARACLAEYARPPHATNLDALPREPGEAREALDPWELYKSGATAAGARRLERLSWATLGYHFLWSPRGYRAAARSPLPPLLASLAASLVPGPFVPEAAIVNYYSAKGLPMGGHRDDVELTLLPPVLSLSLGLPAVFLLGGLSKDDAPVPLLLRSGDATLLGGDSRLCYHGVARVLPDATPLPPAPGAGLEEGDEEAVRRFLAVRRINVNVRQVLPEGGSFPDDGA